jgi:hypothetical protein
VTRGGPTDGETPPESLEEVLASIRALVSAETRARVGGAGDVILLTEAMRVDDDRPVAAVGELLAEGIETRPAPRAASAPIFDEDALRDMINGIVREELQGELGERISRNIRKLIRRELAQLLDEARRQ